MKSHTLRYYLFVILISLLPLVSIFSTDKLFHTHDGYAHLPRIAAYVKALRDGEFPVRWAGDLNYGYGMPIFNFIYPLPYLIASGFVFLGSTLANAFKITLALSYILSSVGMAGFCLAFFKDGKKTLLVTTLYQFSSYRFVELLVRGDIGEVYAYAFLPFVLWGIVSIFKKQTLLRIIFTSISTTLLILSHNGISLLFFSIAFGFIILFFPSKKALLFSIGALSIGLCLSAFYWIPALLEYKYTYGELFMRNRFREYFPPFQNFFIPIFNYAPRFMTKGIIVQFGIVQLFTFITGIVMLLRNRLTGKESKLIGACIIVILFCLFIMHPISTFVWERVSLLRQFQFPWRFLSVIVVVTSFLSVNILSVGFFRKKYVFYFLIGAIIIVSVGFWHPPLGYERIHEQYWWNYPLTTTYFGETDLIWDQGPAKLYPKHRVEVIAGKATIANFLKRTTAQTFTVNAQTQSRLVSYTQFFPGWRVFVNGRETFVQFQDPDWRGLITFSVPKGMDRVRIVFGENKLRLIADTISLSTFLFIVVSLITSMGLKKIINNE